MQTPSSRLETRAVHAGMAGVRESGSHVPVIDFSTTNPLGDVELRRPLLRGARHRTRPRRRRLRRLPAALAARRRPLRDGARRSRGHRGRGRVRERHGRARGDAHRRGIRRHAARRRGAPALRRHRPRARERPARHRGHLDRRRRHRRRHPPRHRASSIVETPANPTLELVDLRRVADAAGCVPLLVDNTFATPVLQRPIEHGATLVLHSATKYLGGHGDVMGGVVAADASLGRAAAPGARAHGRAAAPDGRLPAAPRPPHPAPARARAAGRRPGNSPTRLAAHPAVARVRYPGLPGQDPAGPHRHAARRARARSSRSSSRAATTRRPASPRAAGS